MAHLTAKFAKRATDSLNIEEIATAVSKAPKTIRNTIIKMQKVGLIERSDRGNYRITQKGLMELENSLKLNPRDLILERKLGATPIPEQFSKA